MLVVHFYQYKSECAVIKLWYFSNKIARHAKCRKRHFAVGCWTARNS